MVAKRKNSTRTRQWEELVEKISRKPPREGKTGEFGEGHKRAVVAGKQGGDRGLVSNLELLMIEQLREKKIAGYMMEFRFHPTRRWRFDFAFERIKFAVEVEGGTWSGGRHTTGSGFEKDCEKYAEALALGWRVLRVTSTMVKKRTAINYIERMINGPQ
jgi:very-short-patch-repair endonuclease